MRIAFTLIELLVVVAIMAILAGLLLPAVSILQRSARSASCLSGLRQIAAAGFAYVGDREGLLPMVNIPSTVGKQWHLYLAEYLDALTVDGAAHIKYVNRSSPFFSCREGKVADQIAPSVNKTMWLQFAVSGFGMNASPGRSGMTEGASAIGGNWHLNAISFRSSRAFVGDSLSYYIDSEKTGIMGCKAAFAVDWLSLGWKYNDLDPERHRSAANIVFYDGHAQAISSSVVYLSVFDPALR